MHHQTKTTLAVCSILLALAACGEGSVSERIGMDRKAPDEFRVLSRPPLNVPPEFSLRPPSDGSESSGLEVPASQTAEGVVFGTNMNTSDDVELKPGSAPTAVLPVQSSDAASSGDQNLLNRAGVSQANPSIRSVLRKETNETGEQEDKGLLEKLREKNTREPTVDATKEAERLKTNKTEGKPIDAGETPTKLPKDQGILDKIF